MKSLLVMFHVLKGLFLNNIRSGYQNKRIEKEKTLEVEKRKSNKEQYFISEQWQTFNVNTKDAKAL